MQEINNMKEGSIKRALIHFIVPLLMTSLIQQLYNTVDLIFVGKILGKEASAAVGSSSLLITCLIGFFTGMSIGSSIIIARYFGAGDSERLKETIQTAIYTSFILGSLLTVVLYFSLDFLLGLLNTPRQIHLESLVYIRIYSLSLIPLIIYNMGAGILRAMGDSKSPFIYQFIGGIINLLTNTLFICLIKWGVAGAALASVISQGISALFIIKHLYKMNKSYNLDFKDLYIDINLLKEILYLGVPAGAQATVITLSNLIVQYHINSLGVETIAAFTAYFKVELILYLPIMAFGQAVTTFTGQNIGAGKINRLREGIKTAIGLGIAVILLLTGFLLLFSEKFFYLFLREEGIVELGQKLAFRAFPFYFIYIILEVLSSSLRSIGNPLAVMVMTIINFSIIRVGLINLFMYHKPMAEYIVLVYPITWLSTAFCMYLYYRVLIKNIELNFLEKEKVKLTLE